MYHVLIGKKAIKEVIRKTEIPYLDIVPSHPDLIGTEIELLDVEEREFTLKAHLEGLKDTLDYSL